MEEMSLSKSVAINQSFLHICLNLPRVWSELCSARPGWFGGEKTDTSPHTARVKGSPNKRNYILGKQLPQF